MAPGGVSAPPGVIEPVGPWIAKDRGRARADPPSSRPERLHGASWLRTYKEGGRGMSQTLAHVGSDVCKAWLDVLVRPLGERRRFANSAEGIGALAAWLRGLDIAIARIGLEATGGYEREAAQRLSAAGSPAKRRRSSRFSEPGRKRVE